MIAPSRPAMMEPTPMIVPVPMITPSTVRKARSLRFADGVQRQSDARAIQLTQPHLFVPQRFDRIELRRPLRRIDAEEQSDERRKPTPINTARDRHRHRHGREIADQHRDDPGDASRR